MNNILVKNVVCVTSCYGLDMLAEHTASRSLFESINLQQNQSPPPHPPAKCHFMRFCQVVVRVNSKLQEMLII